jgi:hypothetical protein
MTDDDPLTPPSPKTTRTKLEALANALLDDALAMGPDKTGDKVEIFKPVSLWYLGIQKAKKGEPDDPDPGGTFEDIQRRVNGNGVVKQ